MSINKFAIDFDSLFTNIYKLGSGLVLSEPTVAAVDNCGKGVVKFAGIDARKLIGKTTKNTKIVFPVFESEIVNEKVASSLLNGFLSKVKDGNAFSTVNCLFSVPCGCTYEQILKLKRVAKACGVKKTSFVEAPILSALGQRIPLSDSKPFFVIDMAGGVTNIAVVSLDGIIVGISVNFGYNKVSTDIIDYLSEKNALQIGLLTAEKLKNNVGSLEADDALSLVVNGRDLSTGNPTALNVKAMDIFEPIKIYYDKIIELSLDLLKKLPPEVSAEIRNSGVYVSGIASKMYGLEKYMSDAFNMKVNVAEKGEMSVALGGGVLLGNLGLLKKLEVKYN